MVTVTADDCDGEAEGSFVVVTDGGTGLGAPAGIVTDGVGGLAEGAALCVGEDAALALPGLDGPGLALDGETPDHASAEPEGGGLRALRSAGRHDHGDPGRRGHRRHHGHGRHRARMPPDPLPPPGPGRADRLGEPRRAERARAMRHADPVRAPGRRVVGAGRQYLPAEFGRKRDRRQFVRIR